MKRIEVAVGILIDQQGRCLVGQRLVQDRYYAKWEFPGGKLEPGETVEQALNREFKEELGVEVLSSSSFLEIEHNYPDRLVRLHVHLVEAFAGDPRGVEGQSIQWVDEGEFAKLDFLEGNKQIIDKLSNHLGWSASRG